MTYRTNSDAWQDQVYGIKKCFPSYGYVELDIGIGFSTTVGVRVKDND